MRGAYEAIATADDAHEAGARTGSSSLGARRATEPDALELAPLATRKSSSDDDDPYEHDDDDDDDPSEPALTVRVLVLGSILCVFGAAVSQLFFFKSNAPGVSAFFIILVSYPLGRAMARVLPDRQLTAFGHSFSLNPGPFTKKEHLLIGVLAWSGSEASYAGEILSVAELFYKRDLGVVAGLLLLLTTQLIGFGLAGLMHRLLVRPASMVWPATLVNVTLYDTLHERREQGGTSDRMRFFNKWACGVFLWQFLPTVVWPTLTSIAVLCLINNQSWVLRTLGSGYDGFGFLNFSLDWSVIGYSGALFTPLFASLSYFAGIASSMWLITPALYFSNFWNAQSFDSPVAAHLYDSKFERFDVWKILTPELELDRARFDELKPLLLTPYFALSYSVGFAILSAALTTVGLWHLGDIRAALTGGKAGIDPHALAVERSYPSVPRSWYMVVFFTMFAGACGLVTFYPMQLPLIGLLLAIALSVVFLVPVGIIAAITNTTLGLNIISELVCGLIWPGRPIANVTFKVFSYMTLAQCLSLVADQKLGLYMRIPPRALFLCQTLGTALGSVTNFSLIKGVINSKRPYLDGTVHDPTGQWTARKPEIFFVASVIWGLISPLEFFSGPYRILFWGFAVGAVLPVLPWYMYRRTGKPFWKAISVPLILHGATDPPQVPTNIILPGLVVALASQWWARTYRTKWFDKYNFVLSAALDAGTSVQALTAYVFGMDAILRWLGTATVDSEHCVPGS